MMNAHLWHIIRNKRTESPAWTRPIGQRALPDLSTKRATGRAKKTCQPPHFPFFGTATKQTAAYWLFVASFIMTADRRDSHWLVSLSVTSVQARVCASAREKEEGLPLSLFIYFFVSSWKKNNNHRGIFLCGTANVSPPNKTQPWTILLYVLKSPI